ncbi:MAG: hypothetical protein HFE73_04945 [Firmicutes bacterium]|jgi:hypothetical protein|nr:hypothetical protein [Bacillota bacterium]
MKSKKGAKFILSLFIIIALLASQASVSFAISGSDFEENLYLPVSSSIETPVIKVKNVNNNYLRISWKRCTNAKSYEVFQSSERDGLYHRVGTTTKPYFNDKTVWANTDYYYKVRAISKNGKKSSQFSTIKKGRITFKGKILLPEGSNIRTIAGSETTIHVYVKDCKKDIEIKTYDSGVIATIESKKVNKKTNEREYVVKVKYAETELDKVHNYSVFFKFKGIESRFCLNRAYLVTIPPTSVKKFNGVPLFDSIVKLKPAYKEEGGQYGNYYYFYDSIIEASSNHDNTADERSVDAALKTYMELLESPAYGFSLDSVVENEGGGLHYLFFNRNDSKAVAVSFWPHYKDLDPFVYIMIVDTDYVRKRQ